MRFVVIDFETASAADLRKVGASPYARHRTTFVRCLAWGTSADAVSLWKEGDAAPRALFELIEAGSLVYAHNVFFERCIWDNICAARMGWPAVPPSQWRCTMAEGSRLGLPRTLAQMGAALGLDVLKDSEGSRVMKSLASPMRNGEWDRRPERLEILHRYCVQDVRAELAIHHAIERLPAGEREIWDLDQKINHRGIPVDVPSVRAAIEIVQDAAGQAAQDLQTITAGVVSTPSQVAALRAWLASQGVDLPDLSAETVEDALAGELPTEARRALEIRRDASKASVAKLQAMIDRADEDGRVRGGLVYHGAATGRWAGSGIQIQNFPRPSLKESEIDAAFRLLPCGAGALDAVLGPPLHVLSSCLRGFVRAEPGKKLLVGDFAQIEARVLAWLANQEDLVAEFATGADVYCSMAAAIYGVPVADIKKGSAERQMGKTAVLGCGYGLGHKAFVRACKAMAGVTVSRKFAKRVINAYRNKNANIKDFWRSINSACLLAVQTGKAHDCGPIRAVPSAEWLRVRLPSGRYLHYREPEIASVVAPWSDGYGGHIYAPLSAEDALLEADADLGEWAGDGWTGSFIPRQALPAVRKIADRLDVEALEPDRIQQLQFKGVVSPSRKWATKRTYGGSLTENVVQATARDFLAEAMVRVEAAGFPIIATVHDEIVCEVPERHGSAADLRALLEAVPSWGRGCPISAETYEADRYKK